MPTTSSRMSRNNHVESSLADLFESHGWKVDRSPEDGRFDLIIQRGAQCFVLEIKALAEGRPDRVIPMLSQAILQACAYAADVDGTQPLAVISVRDVSESLLKQVQVFVERYVPNMAIGLVSESGLRYFRGEGLEDLNAEPDESSWYGSARPQSANLFSDLNQWMLKVLLAPDIPDRWLRAPRQKYKSVTQLAEAAGVSTMSASRFLQQLRNDGFLDDSSRSIVLVRRRELLRRWRSAVMRSSPELPMRFLIRGPVQKQILSLIAHNQEESCLALFGAAEALGLGHVSGVPPYAYVPKLPRSSDKKWKMLRVAETAEVPDLIVRQALAPQSVFRGAVRQDGLIVSDVIQVWLDVADHPSRGHEQAELIYKTALYPLIND